MSGRTWRPSAIRARRRWRRRRGTCSRAAQQADGHWPAYWWQDPEYATAQAATALAAAAPADTDRVQAAVRWVAQRFGPQGTILTGDQPAGSPFATAWGLVLLGCAADP